MTRSFTCIVCPNGCDITAEYEGADIRSLTGWACPKGEDYVRQELTDPRRNIASSVAVVGGELPLASVRLDRSIPKAQIFPVMATIRGLRLTAPTYIGQVVVEDVCGTGANVIVTKNVGLGPLGSFGGF